MSIRTMIVALCASTTLAVGSAGWVLAQDEMEDGEFQEAPAEPETIDVSDAQLNQFVEVQKQLVEIQETLTRELDGVEDSDRVYQLQLQANEEMTEAIEAADMTLEEYNQIAVSVQADPDLTERVNEQMRPEPEEAEE